MELCRRKGVERIMREQSATYHSTHDGLCVRLWEAAHETKETRLQQGTGGWNKT